MRVQSMRWRRDARPIYTPEERCASNLYMWRGGEWDRPRLHSHVHALPLRRSVAKLEDESVACARAELVRPDGEHLRRVRLVRKEGRDVSI